MVRNCDSKPIQASLVASSLLLPGGGSKTVNLFSDLIFQLTTLAILSSSVLSDSQMMEKKQWCLTEKDQLHLCSTYHFLFHFSLTCVYAKASAAFSPSTPTFCSHPLPLDSFSRFRWSSTQGYAQYSLKQKRMCIESQSIELERVATVVWAMQSTSLVDHTVGRQCLNRAPDWDKPPSIFCS